MSGTITTKKPMIKETVGAQYYAFNNPASGVEFDASSYEENVTFFDGIDVVTIIGSRSY